MEPLELTFRFDDEYNSLTRYNGLSIEDLAKFLKALSGAIHSGKDDKMVLSEIKSNCYAPVISTQNVTQFEGIKVLHEKISKGDIRGMNQNQKSYYNTLSSILKDNLSLNIYDKTKSYYKTIERLKEPDIYPYYYQTNAFKGQLTKIGSRNIDSKNTIYISSYPLEIEINKEQDSALMKYYKHSVLEFYLTERINKNSGKTELAVLDDFTVISIEERQHFFDAISTIRSKFGRYFSETLNIAEDE